jgi:hypothetical protein
MRMQNAAKITVFNDHRQSAGRSFRDPALIAQIFLLGAEFTKAYANRHGGKRDKAVAKTGTT